MAIPINPSTIVGQTADVIAKNRALGALFEAPAIAQGLAKGVPIAKLLGAASEEGQILPTLRMAQLGGVGASTSQCHEEYQGPAAWSEPETRAVRDFITARRPAVVTDFHAYGNEILYPWGYLMTPAPDDARLKAVASELAALVPPSSARQAGLYGAEGGAIDDWAYATTHALTFTVEVGNENRPPAASIASVVSPYVPVVRRLIDLAGAPWGTIPTPTPTASP